MSLEKNKVLIVEDDPFIMDIYKTTLEDEGFSVYCYTTGEEGMESINTINPDVVLLDILLPGKLNGLKILEKMKKTPDLKSIPVMLLTNLGDDQTIHQGLKLGAAKYFIKSQTTPSDVVRNIRNVISGE